MSSLLMITIFGIYLTRYGSMINLAHLTVKSPTRMYTNKFSIKLFCCVLTNSYGTLMSRNSSNAMLLTIDTFLACLMIICACTSPELLSRKV